MRAPVRAKICCIRNREEARLAIAAGASALGLVSAMPSGPGVISEEEIGAIVRHVPPAVATFLLTAEREPDAIVAQWRRTRTSTIQLVDRPVEGAHGALREGLPGVKLVQVIHVQGSESVGEAEALAAEADALLLDSGSPDAPRRELGGTGRVHDWRWSREIRERVDVPVFLAGGLNPDNVREAIDTVSPFGVDLCSSVRTDDQLDPEKLGRFMAAVRATRRFTP